MSHLDFLCLHPFVCVCVCVCWVSVLMCVCVCVCVPHKKEIDPKDKFNSFWKLKNFRKEKLRKRRRERLTDPNCFLDCKLFNEKFFKEAFYRWKVDV